MSCIWSDVALRYFFEIQTKLKLNETSRSYFAKSNKIQEHSSVHDVCTAVSITLSFENIEVKDCIIFILISSCLTQSYIQIYAEILRKKGNVVIYFEDLNMHTFPPLLGNKGAAGPPGENGLVGARGSQGAPGEPGQEGAQGPNGLPGDAGRKGKIVVRID